jgi:hypothetical protein
VARERGGELVVLGELRGDGHQQLGGQIEEMHRPRAYGDRRRPRSIAREGRARRPPALHAAHARVDALQVRADALEPCIHLGHLLAHLEQQAEQPGRRLLLGHAAVRVRALAS